MVPCSSNNYDCNRRCWKIAVPQPISTHSSTAVPPFPNYSSLTVTLDDPYLDPGTINEVINRLNRELRYEVERSSYHSTYSNASAVTLTAENLQKSVNLLRNQQLDQYSYSAKYHPYQTGAWHLMDYGMSVPVSKPKHVCSVLSVKILAETKEFNEGLLNWYEEICPKIVEEEKKTCSGLCCLLERIQKKNV